MAFVNVGTVITKAMTKMTGGLPRAQFVTWFNEIAQDILRQPRTWKWLETPVSRPVVSNTVTLLAGGEIQSIEVGGYFFTPKNLLTAEEAHRIDDAGTSVLDAQVMPPYQGYTLDATGLIATFHPAFDATVTTASIVYQADLTTDYADNATTIFPFALQNLFIIGLRMHYYDQSKDGRFTKESMSYQMEMSSIKAWDNRRKGNPKFSNHGYIRGVP